MQKPGGGGDLTPTPPPVIPNPLAPLASGVRDLLFSEGRQAGRRYIAAKGDSTTDDAPVSGTTMPWARRKRCEEQNILTFFSISTYGSDGEGPRQCRFAKLRFWFAPVRPVSSDRGNYFRSVQYVSPLARYCGIRSSNSAADRSRLFNSCPDS